MCYGLETEREQLDKSAHRPAHSQECNPDLSVCSSASKYKQTVLVFNKVFSDMSFVFLLLPNPALSAKGHLDRSISTEMARVRHVPKAEKGTDSKSPTFWVCTLTTQLPGKTWSQFLLHHFDGFRPVSSLNERRDHGFV